MENFIEKLSKLLFDFLKPIGVDEKFIDFFSYSITFAVVVVVLYLIKKGFIEFQNYKKKQDLEPYFDKIKVKNATKFFIPTRFQNISPTKEDEPGISLKHVAKQFLIPKFIDEIFKGKKESDKFYLILADSGMGKTTFLINLYMEYNSFFNFKSKYKIKLFPFGHSETIIRIKELADNHDLAKETIILLDAFDEYKDLIPPKISDGLTQDERFRKILDQIFELVKDFKYVIISSRSQFFPDEDTPYELNIPCFNKDGFHTLSKLYLSPFDDNEIELFLRKKYGIIKFWNAGKKRRAKQIFSKSQYLMARPMLLSYIDFLVDDNKKDYSTSFEIYETLVARWIEREAKKRKHNHELRNKFKSDLLIFSQLAAEKIYESGDYSQGISEIEAKTLCKDHGLNLEGYEITGQSLLTRDAASNWKFAHKSIYEFFLADKALEDESFILKLNTSVLDMANKFIEEKTDQLQTKNNVFLSKKNIVIVLDNPNTIIVCDGSIVLDAPSIVAFGRADKIIDVGNTALQMYGQMNDSIRIVKPLRDGVIADFYAAVYMIREMIKMINFKNSWFSPAHRILVCMSSVSTDAEIRVVREAVVKACGRNVYMIYNPLAAAIGVGLDIELPEGNMIVHIGGGSTDIAVISLKGIVINASIRKAGDDFTADIKNYMGQQHNMKIEESTAEMIKINVGSALTSLENPPDDYVVHGPNKMTALPMEIPISYQEIAHCLDKSICKIESSILMALEQTPPSLYADIVRNGIYLSGEGALLRGIARRFTDKFNIQFKLADDPRYALARGAAIALKNRSKYNLLYSPGFNLS